MSMTTTSRARRRSLGVELDQLGSARAHILLRQLHGDAVIEMQIPAAAGDEHRGAHLRDDGRFREKVAEKIGRRLVGAAADHQRQLGETPLFERHDRGAALSMTTTLPSRCQSAKGLRSVISTESVLG